MKKKKFLNGLRDALVNELSPDEVNQQLLYYERYINEEVSKGKTEEEILRMLGEPRLIAKTIIGSNGNMKDGAQEYYDRTDDKTKEKLGDFMKINGIGGVIKLVLILLALILLIFTVFRLLLPILLPVVLIGLVFSLLKRNRK